MSWDSRSGWWSDAEEGDMKQIGLKAQGSIDKETGRQTDGWITWIDGFYKPKHNSIVTLGIVVLRKPYVAWRFTASPFDF